MGDRPPFTEAPDDLVSRARDGDHDAYAELVRRHRDVAFRVAFLISRSAAEAEDAAQEAFVKAFYAIDRFRPGADFRPWLLRIVGNEARNLRRSSGRRSHYEGEAARAAALGGAVPSPEAAVEASDATRRLLSAVDRLPPRDRLVVELRYLLELNEKETARALGIPRGTVKSRSSRALRRLESTLREEAGRG